MNLTGPISSSGRRLRALAELFAQALSGEPEQRSRPGHRVRRGPVRAVGQLHLPQRAGGARPPEVPQPPARGAG